MALQINAGVLKRNQNDYSAQTSIYAQTFNTEKIANLRYGYLLPTELGGLGDTSYPDSFIQSAAIPRPDALIGADFYYVEDSNHRVRYFIDASSTEIQSALESTASDPQYVVIASANSKIIIGG